MPTRAPRACARPGCSGVVHGGVCSRCGDLDLGDRNDLTWAQRIVYVIHAATACDRALALWADRALALWAEEEQKVADQVAQLQRQIDQLGDGVCVAVALERWHVHTGQMPVLLE